MPTTASPKTNSFWLDARASHFPTQTKDCTVDVAVVGAGITGLTAAYHLKKAGMSVAVIEKRGCGGFDTGNTTAHLTSVTDARLSELIAKVGKESTRLAWQAGTAAIETIESTIADEKIHCDFVRIPAYLHCALNSDIEKEEQQLLKEASLAKELDISVQFLKYVPLFNRPGIEFADQAKFHPLKYLYALANRIDGNGSHVFENTEATEFKKSVVQTTGGKIHYKYLVLATHNPLMGKSGTFSSALFQTKLFLYTSYVLGARIPKDSAPEASYWDTEDPYHYLRIEKGSENDYAIYGGEDHKTGQVKNTSENYDRLARALHKIFPTAHIDHQWSGQVIETPDGLPFIGETEKGQFVATGFGGNGMTFGTIGGMMAVDACLKKENPLAKVFDVHRKHVFAGTGRYLKENKDYPLYLVKTWLQKTEAETLGDLKRGEGKILKYQGHKVAAFRNENGKLSIRSAVCTHLQCIVEWNRREKTWDCPCHGSRFSCTGEVLSGPAEEPLKPIEVRDE
jgi:glycine/D-amino acid oxidase-like deaminating enzyme/nitrite reductase/ring-hydroxylating ferredoxin subunit